jgi:predicted ABC-class ATPase
MDAKGYDAVFSGILSSLGGELYRIDTPAIHSGITAYLVRSFDGDALQFSIPVLIKRQVLSETALDPAGADGAVSALIEQVKGYAERLPGLGPLCGNGTQFPQRYNDAIEPYTVIHSQDAIGSHLWKADGRNYADISGIHFVIRGALPFPPAGPHAETRSITGQLSALLEMTADIVERTPLPVLEAAWRTSLDQKMLRERLASRMLVSFIGDDSRLPRKYTRHRCFFRTAGRKEGVNVPFVCPAELDPVELELPATCRVVTGLGIKEREVFAVAGSNAQGKSTFLEGIIAGMDDHAAGDGREHVVTVRGVRTAEASNCELAGSDVSMFFNALPPGMEGTVTAAYGTGSGSMVMAQQVQDAIRRRSPLLIIDEDRAAPNLLVKSCLQQEEINPLSEILARNRGRLGGTALVFAACAMDTLIAQADRIMVLDRHVAGAIDRKEFRQMLRDSLRKTADDMS